MKKQKLERARLLAKEMRLNMSNRANNDNVQFFCDVEDAISYY